MNRFTKGVLGLGLATTLVGCSSGELGDKVEQCPSGFGTNSSVAMAEAAILANTGEELANSSKIADPTNAGLDLGYDKVDQVGEVACTNNDEDLVLTTGGLMLQAALGSDQ